MREHLPGTTGRPWPRAGVLGAKLNYPVVTKSYLEEGINVGSGLVKSLVQPPPLSSCVTLNEQTSRPN